MDIYRVKTIINCVDLVLGNYMYIAIFIIFLMLVWYPVSMYVYMFKSKFLKPINLVITFIYLLICWYLVIGDINLQITERLTVFFFPFVCYILLITKLNTLPLPQKLKPHFIRNISIIAVSFTIMSILIIKGTLVFTNLEI